MKTTKITLITIILFLSSSLLFSYSESSILHNRIEQVEGRYVITPNGREWTIDTSVVTVKLKREVSVLPEQYEMLFKMQTDFIRLKVPSHLPFLDFIEMLKSDSKFSPKTTINS